MTNREINNHTTTKLSDSVDKSPNKHTGNKLSDHGDKSSNKYAGNKLGDNDDKLQVVKQVCGEQAERQC